MGQRILFFGKSTNGVLTLITLTTLNMDINNIKKEYSNGEVTIVWQSGKCIHSANCVKNLSAVFQPGTQPWIKPENASSAEIIAAVSKCPSGALTMKG
jgi:uncharacterized Fe-S cluster protein YjdI